MTAADAVLVTGRHPIVEVRRNLARLLSPTDSTAARASFAADLESFALVEVDMATWQLAATISEQTGVRTLHALHLGAARRLGTLLTFVAFAVRQAHAARSLGFAVVGAELRTRSRTTRR